VGGVHAGRDPDRRRHGHDRGLGADDVPAPDIVVVPGGPGTLAALEDAAAVAWLRRAHETSRWTTSVCTGSLLLRAAGVLQGKRATSHWILRDMLTRKPRADGDFGSAQIEWPTDTFWDFTVGRCFGIGARSCGACGSDLQRPVTLDSWATAR
jgi:putative intracellular protease/amidase